MRLATYFSQLLAGVTNAQIITDLPGHAFPGATERIPFTITEADQRIDVVVLTEVPAAIRLTLTGVRDCVKKVLPALSWRRTLADGRVSVPHPADSQGCPAHEHRADCEQAGAGDVLTGRAPGGSGRQVERASLGDARRVVLPDR